MLYMKVILMGQFIYIIYRTLKMSSGRNVEGHRFNLYATLISKKLTRNTCLTVSDLMSDTVYNTVKKMTNIVN
jgi:hypothetical protein